LQGLINQTIFLPDRTNLLWGAPAVALHPRNRFGVRREAEETAAIEAFDRIVSKNSIARQGILRTICESKSFEAISVPYSDAEAVATFGLLLRIFGCAAPPPAAVSSTPGAVGLLLREALSHLISAQKKPNRIKYLHSVRKSSLLHRSSFMAVAHYPDHRLGSAWIAASACGRCPSSTVWGSASLSLLQM
jgi:hypothetical protein